LIKRIALIVALILGIGFASTACSITSDDLTDPSYQTLRYGGGVGEGSKFKDCLEGGEKLAGDDNYYPYPTSQREDVWDSEFYDPNDPDGSAADHGDLEVVDKDGRKVYVKMKIQFFLNTDCSPVEVDGRKYEGGTLQVFHEKIGKTRGAWFNPNAEKGRLPYGSGWIWAMNNYISSSATDYVGRQAKQYGAEEMYKSADIQQQLQDGLQDSIQGLVDASMETDLSFYKDFNVKIYKITPEQEFLDLLKERDNARIMADTADANKAARIKQAEADAAVAKAQADIKRAEIEGYGGFENYQCIYLADHGLNCRQPVYYVGGPGSK
jgi:hypothetical protein